MPSSLILNLSFAAACFAMIVVDKWAKRAGREALGDWTPLWIIATVLFLALAALELVKPEAGLR